MARVIDLAGLSGAYGARVLVEGGHDVIRVEPPSGDDLRRLGPFVGNATPERLRVGTADMCGSGPQIQHL